LVEQIERKLAAILIADVVGYSRMMYRDETRTLLQLRRHRQDMDGLVEEFDGRIIATGGDNIVAEFPSAMAAVAAAVAIQRGAQRHNRGEPADFQMRWRIGVNVGDVMIVGNDLLGGGVNIAARLESLAEPGGVYVSGTVYDQVAHTPHLRFDDLGLHRVKNIDEDVRVYRIVGLGRPNEQPSEDDGEGTEATATISDAEERQRALVTYVQEARAAMPDSSARARRVQAKAQATRQDAVLRIGERNVFLRLGSTLPIYRPQAGESGEAADVTLGFRRLSRRRGDGEGHAEFRAQAGRFLLADCGSSNGTYLDEVYLADRTPRLLPERGGCTASLGGTRDPPRRGACRLQARMVLEPAPALLLRVDPAVRDGLDDQMRALWPTLEQDLATCWILATGAVLLGDGGFRVEGLDGATVRLEAMPGRVTLEVLRGGPLLRGGRTVTDPVQVTGTTELKIGATPVTVSLAGGS